MRLLRRYLVASALPLLMAGLDTADHSHNTVALNDLAVPADFLYRCSYFHFSFLAAPNARVPLRPRSG